MDGKVKRDFRAVVAMLLVVMMIGLMAVSALAESIATPTDLATPVPTEEPAPTEAVEETPAPTEEAEPTEVEETPAPTEEAEPTEIEETPAPTEEAEPTEVEETPAPTEEAEPTEVEETPVPTEEAEPTEEPKQEDTSDASVDLFVMLQTGETPAEHVLVGHMDLSMEEGKPAIDLDALSLLLSTNGYQVNLYSVSFRYGVRSDAGGVTWLGNECRNEKSFVVLPLAPANVDIYLMLMPFAPATTEEPASTEEPVIAEEPESTEEPVIAEEPESTEDSVIAEEPESMEEPVIAEETESTEDPAIAEEPEFMEEPAIAVEPESMEEPAIAEEPEPTEEPAPTEEPVPEPEFTVQIAFDSTQEYYWHGDSVTIVSNINVISGTLNPVYQWQVQPEGSETWTNIEGAGQATYTFVLDEATSTSRYRVIVTNDTAAEGV